MQTKCSADFTLCSHGSAVQPHVKAAHAPCSAPWCNHEASSVLTGPGSLILMTSTGRPVVIRSYWLGVQAESAHPRRLQTLLLAAMRRWRLGGARPVGLRCLTVMLIFDNVLCFLLTSRPVTCQRVETEMARQGLPLLYCCAAVCTVC
jgi:hypothetical protein